MYLGLDQTCHVPHISLRTLIGGTRIHQSAPPYNCLQGRVTEVELVIAKWALPDQLVVEIRPFW